FANILAGGWQLSWIMSIYSGVPLNITSNVNSSNALGSTNTPDLVGPIVILGHVAGLNPATGAVQTCAATDASCQYFQPGSFAQVPAGQTRYGTAGRNILRGPGFFNVDTGLLRNFRITERVKFQFRVDAFAVTNTPNFGNPNTTFSTSNSSNFGVITSTASGPQFSSEAGNLTGQRTFWFSGKIIF